MSAAVISIGSELVCLWGQGDLSLWFTLRRCRGLLRFPFRFLEFCYACCIFLCLTNERSELKKMDFGLILCCVVGGLLWLGVCLTISFNCEDSNNDQ